MEYVGLEEDRLHFSWISSAEAVKFADVAKDVAEKVKKLGPSEKFVKRYPTKDTE
jgi:coenzyme F420-reducing hydrogenase delta subunit